MEQEVILKQFEEIEKKVGKLIDVCKSLEATNLKLRNKNERLEEELQGKVEAENRSKEERDLIRSKVDDLLVKLDGFSEL